MYTLGIKYYKGYQMPLFIRRNSINSVEANIGFYKLIIIDKAGASIVINEETYVFQVPTIIYLNEQDKLGSMEGDIIVIFFMPQLVHKELTIDVLNAINTSGDDKNDAGYLVQFLRNREEKPRHVELSLPSVYKISNIVDKMEEQLSLQTDNYWPCRSKAYLIEILFYLCYPTEFPTDSIMEQEDDTTDKIVAYIQNHIAEDISIATLSKEFNINRTTLIDRFNEQLKMPPIKYINSQRIELAKLVLKNTGVPITEVCYKVGVNSPAYFSKIFKAATGLSPSQFRNNG